MINHTTLPTISDTLRRLGVEVKKRRSKCPIHLGDNSQALSYDDDKGVWYCHRCAKGGDVIALVMAALDIDFAGALRWFGIEPGRPPEPDPAETRRRRAKAGLKAWSEKIGKELRFEYYIRERIITRTLERLRLDPDDLWGWNWLQWALTGQAALSYLLDMLAGKDEQQLQAYEHWRAA